MSDHNANPLYIAAVDADANLSRVLKRAGMNRWYTPATKYTTEVREAFVAKYIADRAWLDFMESRRLGIDVTIDVAPCHSCGQQHLTGAEAIKVIDAETVKRVDLFGNVVDTFRTETDLNGFRESQGRIF